MTAEVAAPPTPWRNRAASSISRVAASPHNADASVNTTRPDMKTPRRDTRSPSRPASSSRLPNGIRYALTTHACPDREKPSSSWIAGRATFTIVTSRMIINMPAQSTISANHLRSVVFGTAADLPHSLRSPGQTGPAGEIHRRGTDEFRGGPRSVSTRRWHGGHRVRSAGGSLPAGAARPLLSDARLGLRRRGPGAGDICAGVALVRPVRGPGVDAYLAASDRDERLPERPRVAQPATVADRFGRAQLGPGRRADRAARGAVARADAGLPAQRRPGLGRDRPGEHSARGGRGHAVPAATAAGRADPSRRPAMAGRRGR